MATSRNVQRRPGRSDRQNVPAYVNGSAARKIQPQAQEPAKKRPAAKPDTRRQPKISHTVRRNQEKALYMDFPYVMALTVAAICALYICVSYLHVQSSITSRIHNIEKLEKEVENLRSENDALETRIKTSIDLDHIYKVATEELGMVYANKNQVLLFDKTESEYVRQNENIPRH